MLLPLPVDARMKRQERDLQLGDAVRAENMAASLVSFRRVSVDAGFDGFP